MPRSSDDDSGVGQYVPGLDGDRERRLRYQEKLKDAQDIRRQRPVNSNSPSDIFEFGIRQKERRIAIELSSDEDREEKKPEKCTSILSKKRRRNRFSSRLSDSSDSDVVEISSVKPVRRKKHTDPLLKKIDLNQLCTENNIRLAQQQNPELRRSMAILAETSKLIEEIRAPIDIQHNGPSSPVKVAQTQPLPDLIPLDNVLKDCQNSDSNVKICLRILDPEQQLFANTYISVRSEFNELYTKISQFLGKIWLTIDGFEIDRKTTPADLMLQDGVTIKVVTAKPSKGVYQAENGSLQDSGGLLGPLITLKFCASGKQEFSLKVSVQETFGKIRERLCKEHGFQKIVFLMDGSQIDESETVADYDLEDDDQVDVKVS